MIASGNSSGLLSDLNPFQHQAVEHVEGPLLILAGAGSGKTRVITYRIAYLIEICGVPPERILAVTFTNKAADQMKERVFHLLAGKRSSNPLICTFHSLCVRILRREIEALNYSRDFVIYDETDQERVMKACLKEVGLEANAVSPRGVLAQISFAKNHNLPPPRYYAAASDPRKKQIAVLYDRYEKKLKDAQALDFDDLLLRTVELFSEFPEVRARYNERFHYVLVDEYQDTNRAQYELIRHLTRARQNLCVVGDEDQSIYRWRGADIQNILSFEQDYPETRVIKLEQNYRSTQVILDAASRVVSNNTARKGKTLWTDQKAGELVVVFEAPDAEAEAEFIAGFISSCERSEPGAKCAVLYRTNAQSRLLEEACRRQGIGYRIVGGFSFYNRAEVKDLLAYVRFGLNPNDPISFERIVNTPPRGIGKSTLDLLATQARENHCSVWQNLIHSLNQKSLPSRSLTALAGFKQLIESLQENLKTLDPSELLRWITEASGYRKMLESEDSEEARGRLENLDELINAALESETRGETLQDFLDHAALISDQDDFDESATVSLMTMHSAKGLEFPMVFIAGLQEGLFPHSRSLMTQEELEEERRLFYVALTRAQRRLVLTHARSRRYYGAADAEASTPSRFLNEIPPELTENISRRSIRPLPRKAYAGTTYNSVAQVQAFLQSRGEARASTSKRAPTSSGLHRLPLKKWKSRFKLGSQVRHPQFGIGTVLRSEGEGDDLKLTISFQRAGVKKMKEKMAALEEI